MNIEIKQFVEKDREQLRQLYLDVRQSTFTWMSRDSFNLASFDEDTAGEFILVAKMGHQIVGFASVWLQDNFLHHLYIVHPFQGKGIGTRLLNRVIELSNSDVTLKCLKKNERAVKFYLEKGWKARSEGNSNEGAFILFQLSKPKDPLLNR